MLPTPGLRRRLAAMLYEGVILFGVLMASGYVYGLMTQQRHALQGRWGLQAFLFVTLGLYFVWFWTRSGQTVAMKTWHVRLVDSQDQPVTRWRATARYLLSWLWFVPAWLLVWQAGWRSGASFTWATLAGVLIYALLAMAMPQRQFLHDRLCQTRLVTWRPMLPKR